MPLVSTPKAMAPKAFFGGIFSTAAMAEPVQAPVPGRGTATKANRPQNRALVMVA